MRGFTALKKIKSDIFADFPYRRLFLGRDSDSMMILCLLESFLFNECTMGTSPDVHDSSKQTHPPAGRTQRRTHASLQRRTYKNFT